MKSKMSEILLFDDDQATRQAVESEIRTIAGAGIEVGTFNNDPGPAQGLTYEQHIERQLSDSAHSIGLIVCDKELGMYGGYPGLSSNAISVVARNLGIPFCQYSRHPKANQREIERFKMLRRWDVEEITLTETRDQWAKEIVELWRGFQTIRDSYAKNEIKELKPSAALATIMGRESATSRVSLYGSGDQNIMTEILPFVEAGAAQEKDWTNRMPRVLGTWLRLSLLRFPGLLVNTIAAASYLNIAVEDFQKSDIQEPFSVAKYEGPFAGLLSWWWRDDLDGLIVESQKSDGKDYLHGMGIAVQECLDGETQERAGFYCMITDSPVSRSNSKGNINWFPSGADLARIRNAKFDQITSLVSI
jgi:hypothetical protein